MDYKYKLDYQVIAQRIKTARKAAQMTQADLAEEIDISTNAVAKLEANIMTASLQTLINIANILDIDINYLLKDIDCSNNIDSNIDLYLNSLISNLNINEKKFIIQIINGLKIYNSDSKDNP